MHKQLNLLVIEKDFSLHNLVKNTSVAPQCDIFILEEEQSLQSFITDNNIHVVILNVVEDKEQRLNLFKELKAFDPLIEIILVGEAIGPEEVMERINQGASEYLEMPVSSESFEEVLQEILRKKNLRRETFKLERKLEKKYSFQGMIGRSPYMFEIFSLIEKIAKYFSTALVTGETGTGKELVAQAIHDLSQVRNKNLVTFDCTSTPDNLFESELFGYVKGAFTGAERDKRGLFEEAHQGVIFLDEIGEIPLGVQSKLLRVLELHQFRPLGSTETKTVEVKIIAATNLNLRDCVDKGTFREDLLHRLNKVELHLPRLRERPEDIPLLVRHFLTGYSKKFSKELRGVSRQVQKLFLKYEWPGNVRELENVLERAAILTRKDFIDILDLPKYLQEYSSSQEKMAVFSGEKFLTLDEMEKEYIRQLLKSTENNMRRTAQILKISRTTLYNKLKKYNLPS